VPGRTHTQWQYSIMVCIILLFFFFSNVWFYLILARKKTTALPFHMLYSLYLNSYAKQTTHMLISEITELASVQLVLKFLGACW